MERLTYLKSIFKTQVEHNNKSKPKKLGNKNFNEHKASWNDKTLPWGVGGAINRTQVWIR